MQSNTESKFFPDQGHAYPDQGYPPTSPPAYPGLPQNPQGYSPMQPAIVTTGPSVVTRAVLINPVGQNPATFTCPSCNKEIVTRVQRTPTMRTHLMALLLFVIGCWPCCCIPYCMDSCQNVEHYCPNCNAYIGAYQN